MIHRPSDRERRWGDWISDRASAEPRWLGAVALLLIGGVALRIRLSARADGVGRRSPVARQPRSRTRALEDPEESHLAVWPRAQTAINDGDYRGLRNHVLPVPTSSAAVLARADSDAENQQAQDLKKQAEARRPPAPVDAGCLHHLPE
jgi:hypothetical protein